MFTKDNLPASIRIFSYSILALTLVFLINNVLTVWLDWPGIKKLFSQFGLFGFRYSGTPLASLSIILGFIQLSFILYQYYLYIFMSENL